MLVSEKPFWIISPKSHFVDTARERDGLELVQIDLDGVDYFRRFEAFTGKITPSGDAFEVRIIKGLENILHHVVGAGFFVTARLYKVVSESQRIGLTLLDSLALSKAFGNVRAFFGFIVKI